MKSISKLKDDARKHELREEWEKAVQVYLQVLKTGDAGEGEVELPLYNRVGDLYVRLGRAQDAVRYYEQAADRYADAGLYNNAIALCNKAMRYQPHQLSLLRKLGMFSAMQGFYADARRYFNEYADKQIALGKVDDALNALVEFARIADDADSRELLGRRLHERGRTAEAVAELRTAHGMRMRAGQTEQAETLKREIRNIDASAHLDEDLPKPPSGSFGADLPGLSHFDTDPLAEADVDPSASGNVQLDESGTEYGFVDISSFDDMESTGHHGVDTFQGQSFDTTDVSGDDDLLGATEDEEDQPFDLPLLADFSSDEAGDFAASGGAALDEAAFGGSARHRDDLDLPGRDQPADELAEFADFDPPGEDLPYLDEISDATADAQESTTDVADELDFGQLGEADGLTSGWPDLAADLGAPPPSVESEQDFNATADFADWPEDPTHDAGSALDELPPGLDPPGRRGNADDALLGVNLDDFGAWDQDEAAAVEDMALEAAAVTDRALREAEEAERREAEEAERRAAEEAERHAAEAREAEAREAAARELAARELAEREAAAREAAAREAAAREAEARAAAAREDEARAAAVHEAETREAERREAERQAEVRAAAEREAEEAGAVAAREAEARAAEAREVEARAAAAREAEAHAAAARAADGRAAAAREAAAREAAAPEAEAREAAAHDPWSAEARGARPPDKTTRGATPSPTTPSRPPAPGGRDDYVDLGSLFTDEDTESTRFRIHEALPTGDEDQDFAELLTRFKEKVAEHLPPEDAAAHYDLGLAFKEMGLIDEAIAEFQVALRTGHMRLKVYEELGYCFLHKQQYNIAEKVLRQALQVEHRHELELLGIYYQLGRAYEAMGRLEQARDAYERVLGMDLHFLDTSERLARL